MTTIAVRNGYLAADRQANVGNVRSEITKLMKCGSFLYAMAGGAAECVIVAEWLRRGAKIDDAPNFGEENSYGLAVRAGNVYAIEGRVAVIIPIESEYWAAGSGRDFALAAMAMGKSAAEAVTFASEHDIFTGVGVDVVKFSRSRKYRK